MGKIYHAVIIGESITAKLSILKKFGRFESRQQIFARLSSANNDNSHSESQLRIVKALVSRCKAVCAPPADRVASVHL